VASTQAQIPTLQTQIQQAIHRLGVLLDESPAALEGELAEPIALPLGPAVVPAGLPSELVRRRPDVRQAERQLAEATANIGVAVADLFPKFNLTGALGLESLSLKTLASSKSVFCRSVLQLTGRSSAPARYRKTFASRTPGRKKL